MPKEQYKPSPEEMEKAQEMADDIQNKRSEEIMNDDQKERSEDREATLKDGRERGYREAKEEEAIKLICEDINDGDIDGAIKIKKEYNLSEEAILSSEIQEAVKDKINFHLSWRQLSDAIKIKEQFNMPEGVAQEVAEEWMIAHLSKGFLDFALGVKKGFNLPEEVIDSPEVQEAAKEGVIECLYSEDREASDAIKIKKLFNLPEEFIASPEVQKAAKYRMLTRLCDSWSTTGALKIKEEFNLSEDAVQEVASEAISYQLSKERIALAVETKEKLNVSEDIAQEIAKKRIDILRSMGDHAGKNSGIINEIKKAFDLHYKI